MFTVTDAAGAHLADLLKQQEAPDDIAVRFVFEEERISMQPDSEHEGDAAFHHQGRTVLLLDTQVSEMLTGATLDLEGAQLTLQPPEEDE